MVGKPCAHLLLRGKGKAFVGERRLGGWLCGYLLWGSSCRRLQYSYSKSNFARRVVVVVFTLSAACMRESLKACIDKLLELLDFDFYP